MGKKIIMNEQSVYAGSSIILTTKHEKAKAIAHPFLNILSANIIEYATDTDLLGTFSGEIERNGDSVHCAKTKALLGINSTKADYGLSSEGSFGPHPYFPFIGYNNEILYFIDRPRDFHLYVSHGSEKTNYNMQSISSMEQLQIFCKKALFPSHALIIRPENKDNKNYIFKGIQTQDMLEEAFKDASKRSAYGNIWVETDMRANMNPSRMKVIEELAIIFAKKLATLCIKCKTPGWGKISIERGLECSWCKNPTDVIKAEVYGCVRCDYKEKIKPSHSAIKADPSTCSYCNP